MSKPTTKPTAESIVITLEIFPTDAKGNRKLILTGAPKNQMPELRAGAFADRHQLLDELWIALLKREPQVVTRPAPAKDEDKDDEKTEQGGAEENATETNVTSESAFENAVVEVAADESDDSGDQLVAQESAEAAPIIENAPGEYQYGLPIIENDPTQSNEEQHYV